MNFLVLRVFQKKKALSTSFTQQIHIIRCFIEGALARQLPLFITFIGFKKAFYSINRTIMFAILRHYSIPEKIVSAIKVLYEGSTTRVHLDGKLSEEFKVLTGVLKTVNRKC